MSDYLGPNQTRVLDSDYRNFEGVVYQKRKPPLSSEATFSNKISAETSRQDMASIIPSGWLIGGDLKDTASELSCFAGDVMCSPSFPSNSFKLIAADKGTIRERLVAIVNGWRILVQGSTNSTMDAWESNQIVLTAPPNIAIGIRVDFVFLEVWRKLITPVPTDIIYKYGNVNYVGLNYQPIPELIDPAANFETSLRIQLQYRIRTVADVNVANYPEGFDPLKVFAQGTMATPMLCSGVVFNKMNTDPGLWRAGSGDSVSQETLGTVDGYVYAIPMFLIQRRNSLAYDPDTNSNGSRRARADYINGWSSDRPDGLYSDMIVADDILDIRHVVGASEAYKELCESAFRKLINGTYRTKMARSFFDGNDYGPVLVKADAISASDLPGSEGMGADGDGIRRMYTNAQVTQPYTYSVKTYADKIGSGSTWQVGNTVILNATSPGSIISIFKIYNATRPNITNFTPGPMPASSVTLTLTGSGGIVGTTESFTIEYTLQYSQGLHGFRNLPDVMLESGPIAQSPYRPKGYSFAFPGNDIPVRDASGVIVSGATYNHMLTNQLNNASPTWNFGHQMRYYKNSPTSTFTIDRNLFGYDVLGVANATLNGGNRDFLSVIRTSSAYTVVLDSTAGGLVSVDLYTGGKFFDVSAQGRSITNTYEMATMSPVAGSGIVTDPYILDSTNQLMLAFGQLSQNSGDPYCFVNGTMRTKSANGFHVSTLPDSSRTRTTVWFDTAPSADATVEVPVLKYSAVQSSAGYQFFYKMTPYQGLFGSNQFPGDNTSVTGYFRAEGPAIVTTAGSGSIVAQATNQKNIIDRLPSLNTNNDASGDYSPISFANTDPDPTLTTSIISKPRDIMDSTTAVIGSSASPWPLSYRGRSGVDLGLKMGKLDVAGSYQKTYQSYLLDKDCSGELYLMVVSSESDNDSTSRFITSTDSVDIFRMPGRPLTLRK